MLHEDGTAGVAVAGVRLGGHRTCAELGACVDAETQALLALLVGESLQTDLQKVRGLHPLRGESPAGGCHLFILIATARRQTYCRHMVIKHSIPIKFQQSNVVFITLLFVLSIVAWVDHIVDHPKVLNLGIICSTVVIQIPQTNNKLWRIEVWVQPFGLCSGFGNKII